MKEEKDTAQTGSGHGIRSKVENGDWSDELLSEHKD